jgi:hypothetical protein
MKNRDPFAIGRHGTQACCGGRSRKRRVPEIAAVPIRIFVSAAIAPGSTVARGVAKATLYESTVLELVIFNSSEALGER